MLARSFFRFFLPIPIFSVSSVSFVRAFIPHNAEAFLLCVPKRPVFLDLGLSDPKKFPFRFFWSFFFCDTVSVGP